MQQSQAIHIIKETFECPFNKERFVYFVKNLFNNIKDAPFVYRGNYIPDAYDSYIQTLERVGKYQDLDGNKIDVLIVHLKKETFLERARTMQRNFIAWYLNGSRGGVFKDAAVVAFVSPDSQDWRFSLIKMEYKLTESKNGRVKAKQEFTPARRWSFLVGKNESSHTAQSQLVPIIEDDEHNPTLAQLEDAFNIEKVTREFFEKYRELFLRTKETLDALVSKNSKVRADFSAKGVNTVDFAKKLLGQVVFLYFLQKKGWFGVKRDADWGTGPKNFLRELFEKKHGNYHNFFNDILEPLFYQALRNDRRHDDDYYDRFNCKIPFLNGGLFDPINNYDWVHTDILLTNELFFNDTKTKEGDTGNGILDIFDRYNFTVKEDEPLEKEVAVDPELLGKAYEKFNAIRPDNYEEYKKALKSGQKGAENKFNKQYGVYYTPREIVHYMCQQSLINYLVTELSSSIISEKVFPVIASEAKQSLPTKDIETLIKYGETAVEHDAIYLEKLLANSDYKGKYEKSKLPESVEKNTELIDENLASIRVCDPAVGSGAFLVGMMSEIVKARNVLTTFLSLQGVGTTKQSHTGDRFAVACDDNRTIYNFKRECIEKSLYGVDIDPGAVEIAKLRLWLSLVVDEEDYHTIKPLPNLDYKIMQGNSLIEEFHGISLDLEKKEEAQVSFSVEDNKLDRLIEDLHQKQIALFNVTHPDDKKRLKDEVENDIVNIFHYELQRQKEPYFGELKNIEENARRFSNLEDQQRYYHTKRTELDKRYNFDFEAVEKELREWTHGNKVRPFFPWKLYFADVFRENGGFDVVIANPPYGADYSVAEKKHYQKQYLSTKTIAGVQKGSLDTFTIFIELGYNVLKKQGNLNYIVPIAITSSDSMTALHKLLEDNCETIQMSSYSVRPQPVFENAVVNTSILFFTKTNTKCRHIYSTKMYRKNKDFDLQKLVNNLQFIDVADVKLQGRYPKISYPIEKEILKKIFNQDKSIGDLLKAKGNAIYYRTTGGRYFKVITNYSTGSTKEKPIFFEKKIANAMGAILSSNLFFWYYQIYSNNLDLKSYEIESFTIPYSMLSDKFIEKIEKLYDEYLKDIEANANVRQTTRYANIDSFKEYKIGKSKASIDRIDDIIGPLYGLSKEEIEFIKNYEIEFRLGDNEG